MSTSILDTIPPDTPVIENGQVTPIGEVVLAEMADRLIALCLQSHDPKAALEALPGIVAECAGEIARRRAPLEPSPVPGSLTRLAGDRRCE